MKADVLRVDPRHPEEDKIALAAAVIRRGELVAFPTETVYGLGANALDEAAVARIFTVKGRPFEDPLIVHIGHLEMLASLVSQVAETARVLASRFWPGPLTLVLPKAPIVPTGVTAGLGTVAVRIPSHPVALALLTQADVPIAAPSANRFGHTSPTTAAHVREDLGDQINMILDGGATTVGVESTVIELSSVRPKILRPGGVPREAIEVLIGPVNFNDQHKAAPGAQVSPGMLDSHYAPHARLLLFKGDGQAIIEKIEQIANSYLENGQRVGLLLADEDRPIFRAWDGPVIYIGSATDLNQIARNLYAGMRSLDQTGIDLILARNYPRHGLGLAINDRLSRAASEIITSLE